MEKIVLQFCQYWSVQKKIISRIFLPIPLSGIRNYFASFYGISQRKQELKNLKEGEREIKLKKKLTTFQFRTLFKIKLYLKHFDRYRFTCIVFPTKILLSFSPLFFSLFLWPPRNRTKSAILQSRRILKISD